MNTKLVLRVVSAISVVIGCSMLTSVFVAWRMGDSPDVIVGLLQASSITILIGLISFFCLRSDTSIRFRDGFAIVTFSWLAATFFGSIPYFWLGHLSVVDALFETMSGFTTTGASVINQIESLPFGLLYWRSLTQWLGGMGIVVLSLAILPILGIGGMQLYRAEAPGPTTDQLTPRIASSAKILWMIYILLSLAETGLLMVGEMTLFDAWSHTCATVSSGGFSTHQASVKFFDSAYVDWIIVIFMILAGCNFILHFRALAGKPLCYWKDEEFRFYFLLMVFSVVTISASLWLSGKYGHDIGSIIRHSSFTSISILTTTGFCTEDFDQWPMYTKSLLVCLMFIGGCGGSTAGGMKVSRLLLLLKFSLVQIRRCLLPRSLVNIQLNAKRVSDEIMAKILGFFFINISLFIAISLLICVIEPHLGIWHGTTGHSLIALETAFSSVAATLYNIGPGLGQVGPSMTYEWLAPQTKLVLILTMLIGRLEVYTVMVLFLPIFWRK